VGKRALASFTILRANARRGPRSQSIQRRVDGGYEEARCHADQRRVMWRTKSLGRISHFDAEFCQRIITATVQLGFFALATATLNLEKAGTSASVDRVTSCPPYWLLPKQ
jgi:hypothetical protein